MPEEAGAVSGQGQDMGPIRQLVDRVRGQLLAPGHEDYDRARRVFNFMIDRRPAAILRCAGVADVIQGVLFARRQQLPLSIHSGGHGVAGSAVCEGGLMLDLSGMKGMRVNPERRTTQAQAGLLLGEFDHETQAFGLATTLGVVSVTGIAGLTLGGGLGWLNGKYGLACDNVLAADVVTADGELVTASASDHDDLHWALRGGGGNFGVVTSLTYQLHPVNSVLAGGLSFPPEQARDALRFYHAFASVAPDELSMAGSVSRHPEGGPTVSIAVCYCGPFDEGERVLQPLRDFGRHAGGAIGPMSYQAFQSGPDSGFPSGRQHYWKSSYLKDLSNESIDVLLEFAATSPSPYTGIGLQQMTGVASRVDPRATAFAHRDRQYDFLILSQWEDRDDSDRNMDWTRRCFDAMRPYLREAVYVNNLGEQEHDRVRDAYGVNYERLAAVKTRYDPENVFRLNHNIVPGVGI
ncbi:MULTISPECIES: FAD-binding oxidoreductase [Arthrobacter]|nr:MULTISPECIES: FAD-binding oxidoreductase [Arthrobacter]QYF90430.1 FAD-binding oxidoreductase [Arthrobacter sp. PAMC25284]